MPIIRDIPLSLKTAEVNLGSPGFAVTKQRNLLALVNVDGIGVRLTASGVVVPRECTSVIIGMGPHMTRWR